jgi:hypothetical protein
MYFRVRNISKDLIFDIISKCYFLEQRRMDGQATISILNLLLKLMLLTALPTLNFWTTYA